MRAAHSFKGAARIVNLQTAVRVAHAMEDCFALAQQGKLALRQPEIDLLFRGIDLLGQISKHTEASIARWDADHANELREFLDALASLTPARQTPAPADGQPAALAESASPSRPDRAQGRGGLLPPGSDGSGKPGGILQQVERPAPARNAGTGGAADGREPQSPAGTGGRVAGRITLAAPVCRLAPAPQTPPDGAVGQAGRPAQPAERRAPVRARGTSV